ncbi:MAG: hypothetical protein B7Z81_14785, partial [Acidocella sp. 20-61-6]
MANVDFVGTKEFSKKDLVASLKQVGLGDAQPYNQALIERAEQELKQQYLAKGYYAAQVTTTVTPLERNAWQVFRLLLNGDGITAFPTYDQLRPYLASKPCAEQASHETVARALTLLRLTRWLSLVRRRRDPKTGRIKGNLYVLHDEPLTPYEAMQLDPE